MNPCEKCGYRHGSGRCCIDIYQQLGRAKGPSVVGKALVAFVLPILVFIGSVILAEYILSAVLAEGGLKTFLSFAAAAGVTFIFVELLRIFTRKPI